RQKRLDARGAAEPETPEPPEGTSPEPQQPTTPDPELCEVCGTPGSPRWPLVTHDGRRIHETHITFPEPPHLIPPPAPEPSPDEPSDWSTPFPDEPPGETPGPSATTEGDPMADLESGGDSPYESMLAYHRADAREARERASNAQDELTA